MQEGTAERLIKSTLDFVTLNGTRSAAKAVT